MVTMNSVVEDASAIQLSGDPCDLRDGALNGAHIHVFGAKSMHHVILLILIRNDIQG